MKPIYLLFCTASLMAADISKTENDIREYIKLKKEIVQIRNDWNFEKSVLKAELSLIEKQKKRLKAQHTHLKKVKQELLKKQQGKEAVLKSNAEKLADYETLYNQSTVKIGQLQKTLPQFLVKKVNEIRAKLDNEAVIAKKLAVNFAILNEISQRAEKWNFSRETISVKNQSILADVLFSGISSGYAVTHDQSQAYIGYIKEGEWIWEINTEFSKQIKAAIHTFKSSSIVETSLPFAGGEK
jgi:hypothetical protein